MSLNIYIYVFVLMQILDMFIVEHYFGIFLGLVLVLNYKGQFYYRQDGSIFLSFFFFNFALTLRISFLFFMSCFHSGTYSLGIIG